MESNRLQSGQYRLGAMYLRLLTERGESYHLKWAKTFCYPTESRSRDERILGSMKGKEDHLLPQAEYYRAHVIFPDTFPT